MTNNARFLRIKSGLWISSSEAENKKKIIFYLFVFEGKNCKERMEDESVINMRKAPNLSIIKPLRIVRFKLFPASTPFILSYCFCVFNKLSIFFDFIHSLSFARISSSLTFIFNFKSIYEHNRLILIYLCLTMNFIAGWESSLSRGRRRRQGVEGGIDCDAHYRFLLLYPSLARMTLTT